MIKTLIIKTGETFPFIKSKKGDFEDWIIAKSGLEKTHVNIVDVFNGEKLGSYDNIKGIIITGSHSSVAEKQPWSEYTAQWLLKAIQLDIPILGICYGHQLIAYALGGKVGPCPNGNEFGTVDIRLKPLAKDDRLFQGLPNLFKAHATHTDSVLELPAETQCLAWSDLESHQAFVVKDHVWGVQFHPEFDPDITAAYIQQMKTILKLEGQNPEYLLKSCTETPYSQTILKRFIKIVA